MTQEPSARSLPTATYRFQLTPGSENNPPLRFEDVEKQIPYLKALGISHVYLSPVTTPEAGSEHGYNVIDYNKINPELGGESKFREMATALHEAGIGVLIDWVPNHMSVESRANEKWWDVLKNGQGSSSAKYFDIHWDENKGKVALPCGGNHGENLIDSNELRLAKEGNEIKFCYYENRFPVLEASLTAARIPNETDEALIDRLNKDSTALKGLLEAQHYELLHWQEGYDKLNYRRFFNINGLGGVCQENPEVFSETHAMLGRLMKEGMIDGVRIDHIDGLKDPEGYLRQLNGLIKENVGIKDRQNFYVVAEKILAPDESLPQHWLEEGLLHGTTGYDYLIAAGKLLTENSKEKLEKAYSDFVGDHGVLDEKAILEASRRRVMLGDEKCAHGELEPEFNRNLHALYKVQETLVGASLNETQQAELKEAFIDILVHYPVYRFYPTDEGYSQEDAQRLTSFLSAFPDDGAYKAIKDILLLNVADEHKPEALDFVRNLQQFTGPMVAKGTEDTAFYRYHLLRGATEVGGELGHISMTQNQFFKGLEKRGTQSMNVSSTHDTKLGENARLRNLALSYVPEQWGELAQSWKEHYADNAGKEVHPNDQYLLLQTIVATYPLPLLFAKETGTSDPQTNEMKEDFISRLGQYATKALREGKERSDHVPPGQDGAYEEKVKDFIRAVVEDKAFLENPVLTDGQSPLGFMQRLAQVSANVSLQNTMLKMLAPGIPDIYQGGEQWLHTTVDPDNRRTQDAEKLHASLTSAESAGIETLTKDWQDGRIKQLVTSRLLQLRREDPDVFRDGELKKLKVYEGGQESWNTIAFARISREDSQKAAIIYIPHLLEPELYKEEGLGIKREAIVQKDIQIELPSELRDAHFADALRGKDAAVEDGKLKFTPDMRTLPGAVWVSKMATPPEQQQSV